MKGMPLDDSEIAERVAVLKRFRTLLEQQRLKFREYLSVLEKQEESITDSKIEALAQHTELEESIIAELFTIQKVIDPLEYLYANICPLPAGSDIPHLKTDLAVLQEQVLAQNKKNRALLSSRMEEVQQQLSTFQRPYAHKESIYAENGNLARFIDVTL